MDVTEQVQLDIYLFTVAANGCKCSRGHFAIKHASNQKVIDSKRSSLRLDASLQLYFDNSESCPVRGL